MRLAWCGASGIDLWTASPSTRKQGSTRTPGFKPAEAHLRARGLPCVLLRKLDPSSEWLLDGVPAVGSTQWDVSLIDSMRG